MIHKLSAVRTTSAAVILLFLLLSTACSVPTAQDAKSSDQNQDHESKPYQHVTLLVSDYPILDEESQKIKDSLKKNLMGDHGLTEEKADQLIEAGKFELRYIEVGNEKLELQSAEIVNMTQNDKLQCRYYASAMMTVWKSGEYFAVCRTENANFIPNIVCDRAISIEERGSAWSDAEEGYLKPKTRSELITIVIGKTIAFKPEDTQKAGSHLCFKRISAAYDPYPVNENGETYGTPTSADSTASEPDLIAAVGADGTAGYVRKTDLKTGAKRIALYQSNGQTVIGTYERLKDPLR